MTDYPLVRALTEELQNPSSPICVIKNLLLTLVGEVGEVAELVQWNSDQEIQLCRASAKVG